MPSPQVIVVDACTRDGRGGSLIALSDPVAPASSAIIAALGLTPSDIVADDLRVASPGTPRLLVRVRERRTLSALRPDLARLAAECRRLGYLGCFAYVLDTSRHSDIEVHQGDALGRPSAVLATATQTRDGIVARVGGLVHHPRAQPTVSRTA